MNIALNSYPLFNTLKHDISQRPTECKLHDKRDTPTLFAFVSKYLLLEVGKTDAYASVICGMLAHCGSLLIMSCGCSTNSWNATKNAMISRDFWKQLMPRLQSKRCSVSHRWTWKGCTCLHHQRRPEFWRTNTTLIMVCFALSFLALVILLKIG